MTTHSSRYAHPALVTPRNYHFISVTPLTGVIGAEIRGVDLSRPIEPPVLQEIRDAFSDHQVVLFPDQPISNAQHLAFSRHFGEVVQVPQLRSVDDVPEVQMIRRLATDTGRIVGENWHADSTYMDTPPIAIVMRAVDVPEYGGDTGFLSMSAAYEALSPGFRAAIDSLNVVQSATRIFGSAYRAQGRTYDPAAARTDISLEIGDREVSHPLVCRHPVSGRRYLYINRTYSQRIDGWSEEESQALFTFLHEHCTRFDFTFRARWKKDQVLIWDNRCTMHKAIPDYAGKYRLLTRVTLSGSAPSR